MDIVKQLLSKIDGICLGLWVKWSIFIENVRVKLEDKIYEMDKKMKDR